MANLSINSTPHEETYSSIELINDTESMQNSYSVENYPICFNGTTLDSVPTYWVQIFLINLYLLTAALSLFGNVIVIVVQVYGHRSAQNIRKYLINLALSDIILGVLCVPFNYTDFVYGHWTHPLWLCPTVQYLQPLCVFITSITLSLIGLERYLFALHPLSSFYHFLQSKNRRILIGTWCAGLVYSYCIFGQAQTREFLQNGEIYYECSHNSALTSTQRQTFVIVNFALTFLFPFVMLTFSYLAIMKKLLTARHLRQQAQLRQQQQLPPSRQQSTKWLSFSTKMLSDSSTRSRSITQTTATATIQTENSQTIKNRLKTIKMLMMVILLYGLCWMPVKIYQILFEFELLSFCSKTKFYTLIYTYIVCHWLAMANSFVNPIVYACMNNSFRYDFWQISYSFCEYIQSLGKKSTHQIQETNEI